MIPYFRLDGFELFGVEIDFYYCAIGAGLLFGAVAGFPMGRRLGLKFRTLAELYLMGAAGGFLGAHLFSALFYYPDKVLEEPLLLLDVFNGLSSVGGFIGAFLGILLCTRGTKLRLLPYLDVLCYGLSVGFIFGRTGCFLTHDHVGVLTDFPLAIAFPDFADPSRVAPRHDLGFYELIGLVPLVVWQTVYLLRRPAPGRAIAWTLVVYGCGRFGLDFLRAEPGGVLPAPLGDPRYLGLTAAQYACAGFVLGGILLLRHISRSSGPRFENGQDRVEGTLESCGSEE